MKPKLIFDIDGTIYDHDKHIPDSARNAVKALKEAYHHVLSPAEGPRLW